MPGRVATVALAALACTDARPAPPATPAAASMASMAPVASVPTPTQRPAAAFCSDTSEAVALRCARVPVVRHGDTLALGLVQGASVQRVSNPADGEMFVEFRYAGRLARPAGAGFHVVDVQGYESRAVELIDEMTAASLILAAHPVVSPDSARFVVSAASYETCEGVVQLDVWSLRSAVPTREFTVEPFDCTRDLGWWPMDVAWRSADTVSFMRQALPADTLRRRAGESGTAPAVLVRRATGWALDSASAVGLPPRAPVDSL
jgi:hypothetical protein